MTWLWERVDWWCRLCGDPVSRTAHGDWPVFRFPFVLHAGDGWSGADMRDDHYAECGPCWPTYRLFVIASKIANAWWTLWHRGRPTEYDDTDVIPF